MRRRNASNLAFLLDGIQTDYRPLIVVYHVSFGIFSTLNVRRWKIVVFLLYCSGILNLLWIKKRPELLLQKNVSSAPLEGRLSVSMLFRPTLTVPQLKAVGEFLKVQASGAAVNMLLNDPSSASGAAVNMLLNDPSSNGPAEGFGCSTFDLHEITIHPSSVSQCDVSGFNSEQNEAQKLMEARNSDQNLQDSTRDVGAGDTPLIQCRNINSGVCSTENQLVSSIETSIKAPPASLQFYVRSEEGINLYVDLNSSPSDWIKDLKNEVCIYQKVHNSKSEVLHQELKSFGDNDEQMKLSSHSKGDLGFQAKCDAVCTRASLSSIVKESGLNSSDHHPDITDGSLRSSTMIPCSTPVEISGHIKDNDHILPSFSRPSSDVQILMVSSTESCLRNGEMVSLDSEVPDTSPVKSTCNSSLDTKLDEPNCTDSSKRQNSKCGSTCPDNFGRCCIGIPNVSQERDLPVSSQICEDAIPLNTASFENPIDVCPGCSTSVSMEIQLSEVASRCKGKKNPPCQNCGPLILDDMMGSTQTENGEYANYELDQNHCGDPSSVYSEEWERSSLLIEGESSECSQIDNSFERTWKRSHSLEYLEGIQNKRPHINSADQNGCSKPTVKNLRRAKHLAREVLPRRSLRLVSK